MAGRRKTWPRRRGMRQQRCWLTSRSTHTRMGRLTSPCALLPPPVNLPPRCLKSSIGIPGHLYQHNVLICKASDKEMKTCPMPSRQLIEHSKKLLTSRIHHHRSRRTRHLLGPPCQPCHTFRCGHCSPWGQAIDYPSCHWPNWQRKDHSRATEVGNGIRNPAGERDPTFTLNNLRDHHQR